MAPIPHNERASGGALIGDPVPFVDPRNHRKMGVRRHFLTGNRKYSSVKICRLTPISPYDLTATAASIPFIGVKAPAALLEGAAPRATTVAATTVGKAAPPKFEGAEMVSLSKLEFPASRPFADAGKLARHGPFRWDKFTNPIEVERVGSRFIIQNGVTRATNAQRAGITELPAYVYPRN